MPIQKEKERWSEKSIYGFWWEYWVCQYVPGIHRLKDGYTGDCQYKNWKIEIKAEMDYSLTGSNPKKRNYWIFQPKKPKPAKPTPNLYIQSWASKIENRKSGPWKAQQNHCRWYIHIFGQNEWWAIFDTNTLVSRMDSLIQQNKIREVYHQEKYDTYGYPVKWELLQSTAVISGPIQDTKQKVSDYLASAR